MICRLESKIIANTTLSAVLANLADWMKKDDVDDDQIEDVVLFKDQNYGAWCATIYYYCDSKT